MKNGIMTERTSVKISRENLRDAVMSEFGLGFLDPFCPALRGGVSSLIGVYSRCEWSNVQLNITIYDELGKQPKVTVYAPWLSPYSTRQNQCWMDWHRYPDYSICYGHPFDWKNLIAQYSNDNKLALILAKDLKKDVDFWLLCHRLAYENGLITWQKDWPAYPHGIKL
jgi:hypothetical protein